jgi:citrate lyase subunit beta/citryl-CoA lyase
MFVPGNKPRYLAKAAASAADAVLLDLEDGVLPDEKANARDALAAVLAEPAFRPRRFVRVNAVGTPWHEDDLAAAVRPGLAGVCVPKVDSPDVVAHVAERLGALEDRAGLPPGRTRIVAAIESARGLLAAPAIATGDRRVLGLMFGAEDFALDIGLGTHRVEEARELLFARSGIVVAAAAGRVLSIDGVFPDLDDEPLFAADVAQARRLGFDAKSTFNPRQLELINAAFSPQPDEIEYARRVVDAFAAARRRGEASVAVGGQLVDLPIVARAKGILEAASTATASG